MWLKKEMKRNSKTVRFSGEYGGGMPTSWSSERVANPINVRRHVGGAALMPFNSLRALPSKWDDAERWITSPVSSYGASAQVPRRPKAKSGPMGPTDGVILPHDEKPDGAAKEESPISDVKHKDMKTQINHDGNVRLSFSASPALGPASLHQNDVPASKDEVRDVQVDKGMATAGQSKKQEVIKVKDLIHIQNMPSHWNAAEDSKEISKLQRDEAKITAWENLQKAKPEAAVRELEMKLEKKKSASTDKIMNKLRASEMEAQAMRNLLSEKDAPKARTSRSRGGFGVSKYNCFLWRRN
ncbi:remorin 1.4-like isoform X1 [Salvia splendens]|nr:remorin 1.4-like isoform X1 [Salvia splendens]